MKVSVKMEEIASFIFVTSFWRWSCTWNVMPYCFVSTSRKTHFIRPQGGRPFLPCSGPKCVHKTWRQQAAPKLCLLYTKLQVVTLLNSYELLKSVFGNQRSQSDRPRKNCVENYAVFTFYLSVVYRECCVHMERVIHLNFLSQIIMQRDWSVDFSSCVWEDVNRVRCFFYILLTVHHAMILGKLTTWYTNSFLCIYFYL